MPVTSDAPSTTPAALSDLHSVHGSLEARVMQKLDALSARRWRPVLWSPSDPRHAQHRFKLFQAVEALFKMP